MECVVCNKERELKANLLCNECLPRMRNLFIIIDLEESVKSGSTTYWKPEKEGFTTDIGKAGLYSKDEAYKIVNKDFARWTSMIDFATATELKNGEFFL